MEEKKILAIGELLWDLLPNGKKLGGAVANLAYRLNGLGNQALFVSRLGNDDLGDEAVKTLQQNNLDTNFIQRDNIHPTGTVNVFFDEHKNPDYTINPNVAYDFMEISDDLLKRAAEADCIAFGTLAQRTGKSFSTIHQLIEAAPKAVKFYDINLRKDCYSKETIEASLQHSNIVKLNHDEAMELAKMFMLSKSKLEGITAEILKMFDVDLCLVTLEDKGALAFKKSGEIIYSPGYKAKMENPIGAGDAFSAAFVHNYLQGKSVAEALESGNIFGAIVVSHEGAMQDILESDIKKFQENKVERIVDERFEKYKLNAVGKYS